MEHTPSKFGGDPCPVGRGSGSGEVLCAKTRFFAAAVKQNEKPEPCVGFNTTKGKTCFVFCFPIPIIVGLKEGEDSFVDSSLRENFTGQTVR